MFLNVSESIYKEYMMFYDRIYNLKADETENLAYDLIDFCISRKWDISPVLIIISNAAECNLRLLPQYWHLFKKIFNHFKIKPYESQLKPHIAALYSKEYDIELDNPNFPDHLRNYENMEINDILSVYEPNSLMHNVLHDNIIEFAVNLGDIQEETFNQTIEDRKLIDWCCYYGSLLCFRYLTGNGVQITKDCLSCSFIGNNPELLLECLREIGDELKEMKIMDTCIRINNEDYLMELHNKYLQSWSLEKAALALNIKAFDMLSSISNQHELAFINSTAFGIQEMLIHLNYGFDINSAVDSEGRNALMIAARNNCVGIISQLVEYGADIEAVEQSEYKTTALIHAATNCNFAAVSKLIELGAKVNTKDDAGRTALIWAANNGDAESVAKLLESGANVDEKDNAGNTALTVAATFNHPNCISVLYSKGANIEIEVEKGMTPLIIAAQSNHVRCITKLVELGAKVDAKNKHGQTPLMFASGKNSLEALKKLVELGANIEAKDKLGRTPIMYAATNNRTQAIEQLAEYGANMEVKSNEGITALMYAAKSGRANAISKLVELGANIETKNDEGKTALIFAAENNKTDSISKLVELGANIETKDNDGRTPLMHAVIKENINSISKLIELGANFENEDNEGNTALKLGFTHHKTDAISKLIELTSENGGKIMI